MKGVVHSDQQIINKFCSFQLNSVFWKLLDCCFSFGSGNYTLTTLMSIVSRRSSQMFFGKMLQ